MRIETTQHGPAIVIKPRGMLAGADARELVSQLSKHVDAGKLDIVLDCSGIVFVDSAGLEALAEGAETLIRGGKALKLAGENPKLREILDLTELSPLFEAHEDVLEAVESCQ
jgi:anti-anti-sigma factor